MAQWAITGQQHTGHPRCPSRSAQGRLNEQRGQHATAKCAEHLALGHPAGFWQPGKASQLPSTIHQRGPECRALDTPIKPGVRQGLRNRPCITATRQCQRAPTIRAPSGCAAGEYLLDESAAVSGATSARADQDLQGLLTYPAVVWPRRQAPATIEKTPAAASHQATP